MIHAEEQSFRSNVLTGKEDQPVSDEATEKPSTSTSTQRINFINAPQRAKQQNLTYAEVVEQHLASSTTAKNSEKVTFRQKQGTVKQSQECNNGVTGNSNNEFTGVERKRNKVKKNIYVKKYQDEIERGLSGCSWTDQSLDSIASIENYVQKITYNLKTAALSSMPIKKSKPLLKRYWNTNLLALNKKFKLCRRTWLRNGKPRGRNYQSYIEYKNLKRDFRKAQRRAIYDEEMKDLEYLEKEHDIDRSDFFRKISRMTKQSQNTNDALLVDGKRIDVEQELLSIWREHYEDLYTPKNNPDFDKNFKMHVEESLHNIEEESY
ncbi:Hypothetical predicted protein [Paramuricea clavata]|uniref:Uncharacterized protein n=1 Tax=Paramuricea clavata TaxID=317549 RepID=A0A7D9LHL3_PARCT|nr:Hypothetical predicted protein [Paramuricea clavata]